MSSQVRQSPFKDTHRLNTAEIAEREVMHQFERMTNQSQDGAVAALLTIAWAIVVHAERSR